jgi:hypothetical protein
MEGDFSMRKDSVILKNMYDAITELNLWDWLSTFTPEDGKGFMFTQNSEITQIMLHNKVESDMHSGASFAWCMRHMEVIAKNGWDYYNKN